MVTSAFIPGTLDISEALAIRREVFVQEQNIPEGLEFDNADASALHLIIYCDEQPAATGRILHDGESFLIGRLAVLKHFRGQKLGDLALRLLLYKTFGLGAQSIKISAQKYLLQFYKKFGFKQVGDEYIEVGRPHVAMIVTKEDVVYPSDCCACNKDINGC